MIGTCVVQHQACVLLGIHQIAWYVLDHTDTHKLGIQTDTKLVVLDPRYIQACVCLCGPKHTKLVFIV